MSGNDVFDVNVTFSADTWGPLDKASDVVPYTIRYDDIEEIDLSKEGLFTLHYYGSDEHVYLVAANVRSVEVFNHREPDEDDDKETAGV